MDVLSTAEFFKLHTAHHRPSTGDVKGIHNETMEASRYAKLCIHNLEREVFRNEGSKTILDYGNALRVDAESWEGPHFVNSNITLYTYNYGSSIRTLIVCKEGIVDSSPYWVERLPFIRRGCGDRAFYLIPPNIRMQFRNSAETTSVLVTHDNHFGHFIGDTLGLLALLDRVGVGNVLMPAPIQSIRDLIHDTLPYLKIRYLPVPPVGKLLEISQLECMLPSCIPFFLSIYLGRSLFRRLANNMNDMINHRLNGQLLLHRKGLSKSRIVNFPELAGNLIHEGFELITAESTPLPSLVMKLSSASIIATEAGSCHLNSVLMADQKAKIICLLPNECITKPTTSMIISGWPYIFAHPGIVLFPSIASKDGFTKDPMVNRRSSYNYENIARLRRRFSFERPI